MQKTLSLLGLLSIFCWGPLHALESQTISKGADVVVEQKIEKKVHQQEPHRPVSHKVEVPRTNPPLSLPKQYSVKGKVIDKGLSQKVYKFSFSGDSLYRIFKNCQSEFLHAGNISSKDIFVVVDSDKIHQEQHLCPDKSSEEKVWKGAFAICEQIIKEVAATHGIQSNCSRYPHKQTWWKTLKVVDKDQIACPTGYQGHIEKTYEKVQKHICLFSVSEALNTIQRGDLIKEKNYCKMIPKDCHVVDRTFKHGESWAQKSGSVVKTLACPEGHQGHKEKTLQMMQKYSCDNGKVLRVGQPYSRGVVLNQVNTCKAPMKRCGAHAHKDEWEVRVGRKIVKKTCLGGNKVEISYPKLRTMVCQDGKTVWKDNVVNVGRHKVFPSESCKDSPYSPTIEH